MRKLAASLLALALSTAPALAEPAMWKVSDADSSVYLFGSIHVFTRDVKWRTPVLDEEVKSADHVYFELLLDAQAFATMGRAMLVEGRLRDGRTLWDLLTAEQASALRTALVAAGLDPATFERMTPWMAELMLSSALIQGAQAGVEMTLSAEVETARQRGLETAEEQLGFMAAGSEADQIANLMLAVKLMGAPGSGEFVETMMSAWESGDAETLYRINSGEEAGTDDRYNVLITGRNERWTTRIEQMLADNDDALVVVGAGHLVGPGGVPALLAARGFEVDRVGDTPATPPTERATDTPDPRAIRPR
jgi:uncharacterized protein YbaP (TraB family)